tara:strand:- start:911 stop:1318 length:408 start_codon:yes stop_codon:yes gene_type:complete
MNRRLEYISETSERIGQHGILKQGDVIKVDEHEYQTGLQSDKFQDVQADDDFEEEVNTHKEPINNRFFDLRTINWQRAQVVKGLQSRTKMSLNKIAKAMEEVSGLNVAYGSDASKKQIAEGLFFAARRMNWTKQS